MTIIKKAVWWILSSTVFLTACSDEKSVVIQPGAFSEEWPTALRAELEQTKKCAIDRINDMDPHQHTLSFKSGETLKMSGWAIGNTQSASLPAYIQLVGPALTFTALAQKRVLRLDVNQYFKIDEAWESGFELQAVQNAEPGEYQIEILQPDSRRVAQCNTKILIKIGPAIGGT